MLTPARRYLAVIVALLLTVPSVGMLLVPAQTQSAAERRALAPAPTWPPRGLAGWLALPRSTDLYVRDHFALRESLIRAALRLRQDVGLNLGGAAPQVVQGKSDWLFLSDGMLVASGGQVRPAAARAYAAYVCDLAAGLRARGTRLVFTVAPSAAAIFPESLPDWAPVHTPTQSDLIFADVQACGVKPVDLRPVLRASKGLGRLYQHHDSHWTPRGALVAYNQLAQALGRPAWVIPPQRLTWISTPNTEPDLVRLSGRSDVLPEGVSEPAMGAYDVKPLSRAPIGAIRDDAEFPSFVSASGRPGPTVLVIGDSYSAYYVSPYFLPFVSRFAWIHQQSCNFDRRVFDRIKPDYVVLMPVDREASCAKAGRGPG